MSNNFLSPPLIGGERFFQNMKKVIACISRLLISYGKFGIMIFSLSLVNSALKAESNFIYLKQHSQILKLSGVYINEQRNIRNRKMQNKYINNYDGVNIV